MNAAARVAAAPVFGARPAAAGGVGRSGRGPL